MKLGVLDDQEFKKILGGNFLNELQTDDHRIFECYRYFSSLISNLNLDELEEIEKRVVDKIILVHINVADQLNAFRLFETLNDRGLALSAVDLIKNHLLMRATSTGNDVLVNSIVEEWLEMYQKIRNYNPVTFFYRFILSEYLGKVSARQLYEVITKKAKDENWDAKYIAKFTRKLKNAAITYSELIDAKTGNLRIDRRLSDIKFFEAGPSYTLLIKITPLLKSGELKEDQYLKIIDLIELFHLRWGICRQSTSRLNDIYNRICAKLNSVNVDEISNIVEDEYLATASSISDSAFHSAFQEKFSQPSATRTKYIIWKLGNPAGETSLNFDEVHTEHIMPQTLSKEWFVDLKDSSDFDEEKIKKTHTALINKIGNFALIKGEWNISMSNQVFSEKAKQYVNSEIVLTKDLSIRPSWTFDDIVNRTEELANRALEIWKFSKPIPTFTLDSTPKKTGGKLCSLAEDVEIFCKGPKASATANVINHRTFRVHKGSLARREIATSFEKHTYSKLRQQLVDDGILVEKGNSLVFTTDYDFQSASAATSVVLGRASNGQNDWRDINGTQVGSSNAETNEEIITRVDSEFVKRMVEGISAWSEETFPDGKVSILRGNSGSDHYIKIDGKTIVWYYYAKNWVFAELKEATNDEKKLLKTKLSKPNSILERSYRNQIRFHLINDNDFRVVKEIVKNRVK